MLYGNVSVADEPGFVVVTQLVKENKEGYLGGRRERAELQLRNDKSHC